MSRKGEKWSTWGGEVPGKYLRGRAVLGIQLDNRARRESLLRPSDGCLISMVLVRDELRHPPASLKTGLF